MRIPWRLVVAPSMIPRKSGERQKNDKRDADRLAVLYRGGLPTAIWRPDAAHEAMRDLIRRHRQVEQRLG
jgi:transposase